MLDTHKRAFWPELADDPNYHRRRGAVESDLAGCGVCSIEYHLLDRRAVLRTPVGHSADSRGCVELFERIDPQVRRIEVCAMDELDLVIERRDREWTVIDAVLEPRRK
jgi:hypothetical protein